MKGCIWKFQLQGIIEVNLFRQMTIIRFLTANTKLGTSGENRTENFKLTVKAK